MERIANVDTLKNKFMAVPSHYRSLGDGQSSGLGLEDIYRIVCMRYGGEFHLFSGDNHFKIRHQDVGPSVEQLDNQETNQWYYCIL
jgi:hypothetical protein